MTPYDLVVVGGGLVGASLACALGQTGARVAVVEAVPPRASGQPSYDDRSTALAPSTQRIFEALGLWPELRSEAAPIRAIHVSDRGRFGFTRMRAEEEGLEALGWVMSNRRLGEVLPSRAQALEQVDFICPARLRAIVREPEQVRVSIEDEQGERELTGRLLALADGAQSRGRELLGIDVLQQDYGQAAVIANLTPERDPAGRAFERFTDDGPMALLPLTGGRSALIWSVPQERLAEVLALDDAGFLQAVQGRFGYRLGRLLKVGARGHHPLIRLEARRFTAERCVVLGNAAHTLHPVAGQGFNLSLRDVATLAELVAEARAHGQDPGRSALLQHYETLRRADYRRVTGFTHALVRTFGNRLPGVPAARNLGLLGLDLLPSAKRGFMRHATGRSGRLPRLALGLPLAAAAQAPLSTGAAGEV